jgi:NAD(P)H-dependent FMN reductase
MGSVRAGRICPQIASWLTEIAKASSGHSYELVDLAEWPLPADDEPGIPQRGKYAQPHTLAWSEKIASADAFIFVSPQYNWGYPAPLKNAIDHLYKEWNGKPAVIATYGGHGGDKCASQLRQVLEAIGMRPTATMPAITITREMMMGSPIGPEINFVTEAGSVQQAIHELTTDLQTPAP